MTWMKLLRGILDALLQYVKKRSISIVIAQLAGKYIGFRLWVLTLMTEYLWDEIGGPLIERARSAGYLFIDQGDGKIKARKVKDAQESGNAEDYNNSIRNILH